MDAVTVRRVLSPTSRQSAPLRATRSALLGPLRWIFVFATAFFLAIEAIALTEMANSQTPTGETRRFTLWVRDASLPMPDGSQMYVWGFTDDPNGPAKIPGPPIVVNEGDQVEVTLINDRDPTANALVPDGEGHTIHLHGLDTAMEHDGVPETYAPGLVRQGGSYTYSFRATHAGTYFYHCHQNNVEHQQMGMYGALVVKAAGGARTAYTGGPAFDREHTIVLAEMGREGHDQARRAIQEGAEPYNWLRYVPSHFFINDRASTDASAVTTSVAASVGEQVLVRALNAGYVAHALTTGERRFRVVATDGRAWPAGPTTNAIWLGPGEKYDLLFVGDGSGSIEIRDRVDAAYVGPAAGAEALGAAEAAAPSGRTRAFTFYVRAGQLTMPDGTQVYVHGVTDDPTGGARVPGPPIVAIEGDRIEITLVNDNAPGGGGHALRIAGLDGEVEGPPIVAPGQSGIYSFFAARAGSYFYTDTSLEHQRMGMYGAVVVGLATGEKASYRGGPSFQRDYTMVLSEIDSAGNEQTRRAAREGAPPYAWERFSPNYFLINGMAYPDTAGDASTMVEASPGEQVLIRALNAGSVPHAMHLHGYHFVAMARAGRPWQDSPTKDTILIAPGESYDLLFTADQTGTFPFHDHFEIANTNNGVWLGGMHTMVATGVAHTPTSAGAARPPDGPQVLVRDNFYTPNQLTVPLGTTVTWLHEGRVEHTVSSLLGYFDSGVLRGGNTFSYTFGSPGSYDYFCRFHISNRGKVLVQ